MSEVIIIPFSKLQDTDYMKKFIDRTKNSVDTESVFIEDYGKKKHSKEEILSAYQEAVFKSLGQDTKYMNNSNEFKNYWLEKYGKRTGNKVPSIEAVYKSFDFYEDNNKNSFHITGKAYDWQKREKERFQSIDGEIGDFQQGRTDDCWLLTGLKATAQAKAGVEKIKNSISKDKDGNYVVTFDGKEKVTVSEEEFLSDKNKHLSAGDPDAKLFEIATRKLKDNSNILNKIKSLFGNDSINGGFAYKMIHALTGTSPSKSYAADDSFSSELGKEHEKIFADLEKQQKQGNLVIYASSYYNEPGSGKVSFGSGQTNKNILDTHAYTVNSIDSKNNTITLLDPNDTSKPITLSYQEFLDNFHYLMTTDLDKKDT
ncbi:MAG: hypothetical protein A2Y25_00140 [Candidatus Melainabacteria bacterium GWF2_37_15]|nr:MAG: hypothetical protein A2Y25_00140 [Candidatus Melainabacteria bacterium GWF2_37_15]